MVTADDHAHHRGLRERRATSAAAMGVAFQGVYALGQFVIMALLVRRLDPQRFGMWLMIYSLTAWAAFAKFGLHFSLYTSLGQHALSDRDRARAILTNAAAFVALLGGLLAAVLLTLGWWLPWAAWLNVSDPLAVREAAPVAVVALTLAAVTMPMMMGGHAMLASQRGDITQSIAMVMQVAMIGVLTVGCLFDWPLVVLAAVVMSPPLVAGLAQWCVGLMTGVLPRPAVNAFDMALLLRLLVAGVLFMVLDLATIALLQGGALVLGHAVSPEAVVPYGAAYRLIGLVIAAVMVISYAYWPAYSEAGYRADAAWIGRGLRRSLTLMILLGGAGGAAILTLGRPFIAWWLGDAAVPAFATLIAAVIFAGAFTVYVAVGTPLSGMGKLRGQVIAAGVMVAVFLVVGIRLAVTHGATGLFVGQAIAACAGAALNGLFLRRTLRELQGPPR